MQNPDANARPTWSVDSAVDSEEGVGALREFCSAEHSEESLEFIVAASAWRAAWVDSDEAARRVGADKLLDHFLVSGAPFEICVPSGKSVKRDAPLKGTMFDEAMKYARTTLIMDIWPRFEESPLGLDLRLKMLNRANDKVSKAPVAAEKTPHATPSGSRTRSWMSPATQTANGTSKGRRKTGSRDASLSDVKMQQV